MHQWVLCFPSPVETRLFTPLKIYQYTQRIKAISHNVDSSTYEKQLKTQLLITSGPLSSMEMSLFAFWFVRQHHWVTLTTLFLTSQIHITFAFAFSWFRLVWRYPDFVDFSVEKMHKSNVDKVLNSFVSFFWWWQDLRTGSLAVKRSYCNPSITKQLWPIQFSFECQVTKEQLTCTVSDTASKKEAKQNLFLCTHV